MLIRSWVESANDPNGPFPVNNLPFGVFSAGDAPRCCVAIGDALVDLAALERLGLIPVVGFAEPALNALRIERENCHADAFVQSPSGSAIGAVVEGAERVAVALDQS